MVLHIKKKHLGCWWFRYFKWCCPNKKILISKDFDISNDIWIKEMQGSKNRNKCLSISMEQSLWNRWTTRLTLPDYEELEPWPGSMLLFYYVYLYISFFIYSSGVIANSLIILFIAAKKSRKMIVYHFILLELAIIDLVDHLLLVNFSKLFSTL